MDKALKQRLVGASVLIILAVIVLPMLLSGRSDTLQQESRQIELPPKPEELSVETRRFPVGIPNQVTTAVEEATPEDDSEPGAAGELKSISLETKGENENIVDPNMVAVENVGPPAQTDTVDTSAKLEKLPPVTSITLSSGKSDDALEEQPEAGSVDGARYLVQVASFSSERNANALAGRLRAGNMPVLMDEVDRTGGRLHRVRVGPYSERADADAVVSSLRAQMKDLSPRVLDLRPGESAPVSEPSDPLVRWVVQVGSFGNANSADALVAKLRLSGLTAFSEQVRSAGNTAYKVRIGPEIDRDKATELARKVKAEHDLDAFVTTQE
jgi:cell division septation protein DedD